MDAMARAHQRDYWEKGRINDLQEHIGRLGRSDNSNLSPASRQALQVAFKALDDDSAAIVRRWD